MARWNQSHKETGFLPDGAPKGAPDVYDHTVKHRVDQFIRAPKFDRMLIARWRTSLRGIGVSGGTLEYFRIACYPPGGHFAPHRDNQTPAEFDRAWSLVAFLNDDYKGGVLCFPELDIVLKPVRGTAVMFTAPLLHGVMPVEKGRRFVLVNFHLKS
jgi:predicted 2-oxoglutarate/Fe(II)-dependent dioxygenase YbiX